MATSSSATPADAAAEGAPAPSQPADERRVVEYYAETRFRGADLSRHVHIGWGVMGGAALIGFCMIASAATQRRSWNVSFLWLQRRVGAQFGTLSYMITDNLLHYYDGDKWVTRDWNSVMSRWAKKDRNSGSRTFASSAS